MIAIIFAEHVNAIILPALAVPGGWVADRIVALLGVLGITGVNCLGVKTGAKVAIWFLALKLLIISSIVLAGLVVAVREKGGYLLKGSEDGQQTTSGVQLREEGTNDSIWGTLGDYVTAGFAALWVYGGWEAVSAKYSFIPFDLGVWW
jgi:amino acid transporter